MKTEHFVMLDSCNNVCGVLTYNGDQDDFIDQIITCALEHEVADDSRLNHSFNPEEINIGTLIQFDVDLIRHDSIDESDEWFTCTFQMLKPSVYKQKPETIVVAFGSCLSTDIANGDEIEEFGDPGLLNGCFVKRTFQTKAEKDAYFKGIDDGDGWLNYYTLDSEEQEKYKSIIDSDE